MLEVENSHLQMKSNKHYFQIDDIQQEDLWIKYLLTLCHAVLYMEPAQASQHSQVLVACTPYGAILFFISPVNAGSILDDKLARVYGLLTALEGVCITADRGLSSKIYAKKLDIG